MVGSTSDLATMYSSRQLLHVPERVTTPKLALLRGSLHHSGPEKLQPGEDPLLGAVFSTPVTATILRSLIIRWPSTCGSVMGTAPVDAPIARAWDFSTPR